MGNDLIREGRLRRGMTQTELARLIGTTQSAVARLESGRTSPSFDDVIRILRAMDLDLDFALVPRDEQDWAQAAALLELNPAERHERLVAWNRRVAEMKAQFDVPAL